VNCQNKIIPKKYKSYSRKDIDLIPQIRNLGTSFVEAMKIISIILPFRVNNYIIDELIDWNNIPNDPIFQMTFPQPSTIDNKDFCNFQTILSNNLSDQEIYKAVKKIHEKLNPHPAGQMDMNVPLQNGKLINGIQHKYNETVLFFPLEGQTCHTFCSYCFRWPQFIGFDDFKFSSNNINVLIDYIDNRPEITDLLFTGGDPLIMRTKVLEKYINPLLQKRPGNITTIRIGTKVPAFWPYRFLTDNDSDDLMHLFDKIIDSGFHLAIMSHFSHPNELKTKMAQAAIKRILSTGAMIRCQAPLIKNVNDKPEIWTELWKEQVKIGAVPYYMFIARNTGAEGYYKVPLSKAYDIFTKAYANVTGLCRTVRGPSMSSKPGKILIDGVTEIGDEKIFVLKFIQGRNKNWVNRIFFAKYDETATWLNELQPAFGEKKFFFEKELAQM